MPNCGHAADSNQSHPTGATANMLVLGFALLDAYSPNLTVMVKDGG